MGERYQTTSVEASTLLDRLWCRNCGGPLLAQRPLALGEPSGDFSLNFIMSCVPCMVPDRHLASDSGKIADRLLYYLITEGIVRIRIRTVEEEWVPPEGLPIHESTIESNSARSYLSEAVRGIPGIWVATHSRLHKTRSSYILGHLKVRGTPCSCDLK